MGKIYGKMFPIIRVPIFEFIILQHMYFPQTIFTSNVLMINILQQQNTIISESSKLSFYREFDEISKRASYVDELTNCNDRPHLTKLKLSAHSLDI